MKMMSDAHSVIVEIYTILLHITQPVLHKVTLDWLEVLVNLKVEWNSATIDSGAQFVMMPGELPMLQWSADSWDSQHQVSSI